MAAPTHPEAFVLLHIPDVALSTAAAHASGTLALECVALATAPPPPSSPSSTPPAPLVASLAPDDRSLILVLRLGALELPLDPARAVRCAVTSDGTRTYTFLPPPAEAPTSPVDGEPSSIELRVPPPPRADAHRAETVEALEHILAQYMSVEWTTGTHTHEEPEQTPLPRLGGAGEPAPPELRGKLVLVDEASGDVLGELPSRVDVREDPALANTTGAGGKPAPVMLELPDDMYDAYTGAGTSVVPYAERADLEEARAIFVRAIPPEDQDWMTKSATLISSAISTSTSLLLGGLTGATNYYINHSTPAPPPKEGAPPPRALLLMNHPRTQSTLSRAYAISGQAVKVSQRTVGIVENIINKAVGGKDKTPASAPVVRAPQPQAPPPPPPRPSMLSPMVTSPQSESPPPAYPGAPADSKPPLPPRRSANTTPVPGPAPPLPPRGKSPIPPSASTSTSGTASLQVPPPPPPTRLRTRDKMLLSANLVLATVDDSLARTFDVASDRASAVAAHKYGPDAGRSTALAAHTARNVTLVYIDVRGFARKALVKRAAKSWIKAHVGSGAAGRETSGVVVDKEDAGGKGQKR